MKMWTAAWQRFCERQTLSIRTRSAIEDSRWSLQFRFQCGLAWISPAAFKPRFEFEQWNGVRSSRIDIHGQILNSVIADHFRFADLFQSSRGRFKDSAGVDRN
jgi:hypothetical protein